jgi:thymidylate synthase (FAD)
MDKIEFGLLNINDITATNRAMMKFSANLCQHGHEWKELDGLNIQPGSDNFVDTIVHMPHPTLQKFTLINMIVRGASRRFLAQITRHQDCKFMSSSFHYGDHSDDASFVTPYKLLGNDVDPKRLYQYNWSNQQALTTYREMVNEFGTDEAAYALPNATRTTLMISATPFQWKHMISQRTCRRNCNEIRYVMLRLWGMLYELDPIMFQPDVTGPDCQQSRCKEGKMSCCRRLDPDLNPFGILAADFPKLVEDNKEEM